MTELLTDNLPLLAGAPNGIKKLRELILELAVRGKLVPQYLSDEPASELLRRIAEEKARVTVEGKIKKQKLLAKIDEEEKPFELPEGWEWQRFGEIFSLEYGDNLPADKRSNTGEYPVYGSNGVVGTHNKCFVASPCIIVGRKGSAGALNLCIANGCCVTDVAYYCIPPSGCSLDYVFKLFHTLGLDTLGKGIKPGLSRNEAYELVVAIPPLPAQQRIVAKVDELMALCDRLEAQQTEAKSAHAQVVQALLDSLTQVSDATDFTTNWQRLAEHFHTLLTTEASIEALKQTLLQLAVMGKLVPQAPNDEPASELLKRIAEEKARLVASKTIKASPPLEAVSECEKLFDIPTGWEWVRIGEICRPVSSGSTPSSELFRYEDGVPFLKVYNIRNQEIDFDYKRQFVSPEYHSSKMKRSTLIPGDVVMNIVGPPLGKVAIIPNTFPEWNCNQAIVFFGLIGPMLPQYVFTFLKEGSFLRNIALIGTAGQDNISVTKSKNIAIPIPPIAEQYRIVAKIDQLMVLCDQLKSRLTQARQLNEQLAITLVERALVKDAQQTPIAMDRQVARTLLAAEITHQLHSQRTFGQRKLQKVIYLAEHTARLAAIQGDYLRDAAGPHDRQLMNDVEGEMQDHQWYERIERENVGHAYRPLSQAGQHRQAYYSTWPVGERTIIEQVIELMRNWDTDRCEMTVTLYAAWNDFILEGRPVSDEAIVDEVMHSWNNTKLRFGKTEWLAVLAEMKKHKILMPSGFGKRTTGGMLSLPGFE
ncbi:restriction endonuclease subunit S [Pseudomonas fluorescens]|uniref:Type I restriction modification DNA specificity domain-containing protein n=1 Tax=Pseudomonas fluorescens TaxID=294 RepID=A0A5E7J410_PSEFL|nr:restriction endonuclease subunit S [Pseudomonas fluorescens]VVO83991.1 hypothetical protein PS847_01943 [Pseudomonas fluorescens]